MKKSIHRIISIVCVMTLLISLNIPAVYAYSDAASNPNIIVLSEEDMKLANMIDNMTNAELSVFLRESFGVAEQEAQELVRWEGGNDSVVSPMAFPSNPVIGQKYVATYRLNVETTTTVMKLAGKLVQNYNLTWGLAITLAGNILNLVANKTGVVTVLIEITYIYGTDNDGEIRWVVGPSRIELL